jgi:hypothetical protein
MEVEMKIEVHTQQSSTPKVYPDALGGFEKGSFYCVFFMHEGRRMTHMTPIQHIFRIQKDYEDRPHGGTSVADAMLGRNRVQNDDLAGSAT